MKKLTAEDLWKLKEYEVERSAFRKKVMEHKNLRRIQLGKHASLLFEDTQTMKYQIQEMVRTERIFKPDALREEINVYNQLIPDGRNWKATLMLEYPSPTVRAEALARMLGIEHKIWIDVGDLPRVFAIADEDMDRTNETKTSAVHFLRFEFAGEHVAGIRSGLRITMGIDHPVLPSRATVDEAMRESLLNDFDA